MIPSDAELLARWDEAYRVWLDWYHDETPGKGWGVGQDAAFHMGRVAASMAERLRAAQSGEQEPAATVASTPTRPDEKPSPAAPSALLPSEPSQAAVEVAVGRRRRASR